MRGRHPQWKNGRARITQTVWESIHWMSQLNSVPWNFSKRHRDRLNPFRIHFKFGFIRLTYWTHAEFNTPNFQMFAWMRQKTISTSMWSITTHVRQTRKFNCTVLSLACQPNNPLQKSLKWPSSIVIYLVKIDPITHIYHNGHFAFGKTHCTIIIIIFAQNYQREWLTD